jgi:serine phosphatase RsbU (regulator of sigma subunit)
MRRVVAPALWQQLSGRASHLIIVSRETMKPILVMPESESAEAARVVSETAEWIKGVAAPSQSYAVQIRGDWTHLLAMPMPQRTNVLAIVAVPVNQVELRYFSSINSDPHMTVMLFDEQMRVQAAFDKRLIGYSVIKDGTDPSISALAATYLRTGVAGTEVIPTAFSFGPHQFESGIVSLQPIQLLGKRWWLTIGSDLDEAQAFVKDTLREVYRWSIFFVASMTALLVSTAVQMIRSRSRLEKLRHETLHRELSQARSIQVDWLPSNDDDPPGMDLHAVNRPASHISGDFYNWFELSDSRVCVVIGDVTGHGMSGAFLMATTQLLVRMTMDRVLDPGKCLHDVNQQLRRQCFAGQFVTMLLLTFDRKTGELAVASAGHPPPLLVAAESVREMPIQAQLVLGIDPGIQYPTTRTMLGADERVLLYTDGVVDAQAPDNNRFGVESLQQLLGKPAVDAKGMVDAVIGGVDLFRGTRECADDLTLVAIHPLNGQVAARSA